MDTLGEVVDSRKLDESCEDEREAEQEEEVESCRVRHLGYSLATRDSDRTSGEQCGDSYAIKSSALIFVKKYSSTHSVIVCDSSHSYSRDDEHFETLINASAMHHCDDSTFFAPIT